MRRCSVCGAKLSKGERFCTNCGHKFTPASHCSTCDTRLPKGAKYCIVCGKQAEVETYAREKASPNHFKRVHYILGAVIAGLAICLIGWLFILMPSGSFKKENSIVTNKEETSTKELQTNELYSYLLTSITTYDSNGDVIPSEESFSREYDEDGRIVRETGYDSGQGILYASNYVFLYDDFGRLESVTLFYLGVDGVPTHYRRSDIYGRTTADVYYTDTGEVEPNRSHIYNYCGTFKDPLVMDGSTDFPACAKVDDTICGVSKVPIDSYYVQESRSSVTLTPYERAYDTSGKIIDADSDDPKVAQTNVQQSFGYDASGKAVTRIEESQTEGRRVVNVYDINSDNLLKTTAYHAMSDIEISSYEYSYDNKNQIIKKSFTVAAEEQGMFDMDSGYHTGYYSYKYDKNGNLTQQRLVRTSGKAGITTYWQYSFDRLYDKNNNLIQQTVYPYDESTKTIDTWEFDKNSVLLSTSHFYFEGVCKSTDYEYDENGEMKSITCSYSDQENGIELIVQERTEYSTSATGNIIVKKGTYNETGELNEIETWEYDRSGRILYYALESAVEKTVTNYFYQSTYSQDGKILRENIIRNGELLSYTSYLYDSDGYLIKKTGYSGENEITGYTQYGYSYVPIR